LFGRVYLIPQPPVYPRRFEDSRCLPSSRPNLPCSKRRKSGFRKSETVSIKNIQPSGWAHDHAGSEVGKKGCRHVFNMCGEIWWWVSRRVAPGNFGPFYTFSVGFRRVVPENFGPFTLFLVKSGRVAPGNFGAYFRPLSRFPTWPDRSEYVFELRGRGVLCVF
jgi:hypothetical protein